jgi:hypothetical protein
MENEKKPSVKKETISELAHRHLKDPNHTTTDEELRNATVELTENVEEPESLHEIDHTPVIGSGSDAVNEEADTSNDDDNKKGNRDDDLPNPYSVLSS